MQILDLDRERAEKENFIINSFIDLSRLYTAQEIAMQLSPATDDQLNAIKEKITEYYREDLLDFKYLIIDTIRDFLKDFLETPPELVGKISQLYTNKVIKGHNGHEMGDDILGSKIIKDIKELGETNPQKATSIARGLLKFGREKGIVP